MALLLLREIWTHVVHYLLCHVLPCYAVLYTQPPPAGLGCGMHSDLV